ncbi:MAG: STAS/SEC14 domain-containing protein [Gammaproteobacteria bacterium]|nr:STAS/SEC14 domain-containing protein [Gammaproteobacteria bacterium]
MLSVEVNESDAIALLETGATLAQADLEAAARVVDPYLKRKGKLNGLIIRAPGHVDWDAFATLAPLLRFTMDQHRSITRIALVTDSDASRVAGRIAPHFVNAKIKIYPNAKLEYAREWILADVYN